MTPTPKQLANLKHVQPGQVLNPNGRPKITTFKQMRELAQEIANEEVTVQGQKVTRLQKILAELAADKRQKQVFVEIGFGKVPNPVELTGANGGPLEVSWKTFVESADDTNPSTGSE